MFHAIYLSIIEEETGLVKYIFLLFFTENSSLKEEKMMKFLTGSYGTPILGALPSIKGNFKHDCVNRCTDVFPVPIDIFLYIRVTSPYPE